MLYDDIQQLEVRYVISLEYHDVDIYSGDGDDAIPEGELWIKRNAIRLQRKQTQTGDHRSSLPFFLFGESQSEKEDFYFALLKNQQQNHGAEEGPVPQEFEAKHIVTLVQKLHSSEEHLQTRWLNALIGRFFLAMYKTPEFSDFFRQKLTKKISRVKKPNFITKLALRKIDTGNGAPFITSPRLKDLTVNGDCTVEADVNYTGNFRIEIAATARIDLGPRFKAREVDLVLAVTCKKLEGHALLRFKPPPSNRVWFTFEKVPQMDLVVEPVVSSRQITYSVILRAIESRIREVVAESVCFPFWDDIPFLNTSKERFRGGIWKREPATTPSTEIPDEEIEDEAEAEAGRPGSRSSEEFSKTRDERSTSMPVLNDTKSSKKISPTPPMAADNDRKKKKKKKSVSSLNEFLGGRSAGGAGEKLEPPAPRLMRSTSFASAANPMITTNHADVDGLNREADAHPKRDSAAAVLKDLSARSTTASPSGSPAGSPPTESAMAAAIKENATGEVSKDPSARTTAEEEHQGHSEPETPPTPPPSLPSRRTSSQVSLPGTTAAETDNYGPAPAQEGSRPNKGLSHATGSFTGPDRKYSTAPISAATAAAQKWGWGVLARNRQREAQAGAEKSAGDASGTPPMPMGRGRPLPPPGVPLPPPQRSWSIPKRKPVPPPLLPKRPEVNGSSSDAGLTKSLPGPPLPERRKRQSSTLQTNANGEEQADDEVLVVEAPTESAPTSPTVDEHHDDFFGHGEPTDDHGEETDNHREPTDHGEPTDNHGEPTDNHREPTAPEPKVERQRPPLPARRSVPDFDYIDSKEEELSRQEIGTYS